MRPPALLRLGGLGTGRRQREGQWAVDARQGTGTGGHWTVKYIGTPLVAENNAFISTTAVDSSGTPTFDTRSFAAVTN